MSAETVAAPSRNLFQKLAAISGELGAITKDGEAPAEMGGFRFMSHGALMGHLREKLAEQQVAILPSLEIVTDVEFTMKTQRGERSARRVVVRLSAEFVNGEKPDDRYTCIWYGEGIDTADKAVQKAATSAEKYLLSKTFKVSDRDDPDGADLGTGGDAGQAGSSGRSRPAAGEQAASGGTSRGPRVDWKTLVCPHCGKAGAVAQRRDKANWFCSAQNDKGGCGKSITNEEAEALIRAATGGQPASGAQPAAAAQPPASGGAPVVPMLTAEQRRELASLNEALPAELRLTDEEKRAMAAEGFEAMKERLLAREQQAHGAAWS